MRDSRLVVEFAAPLDQTQQTGPELFTVTADGVPVPVRTVTVTRNSVVLRLCSPACTDDHVLLSIVNTATANVQLRTVYQTPISDFAGLEVRNTTPSRFGIWGC